MMGVNDVRAGGAFVELTADSKKLKADLAGASKDVSGWASSLSKLADFSIVSSIATKLAGSIASVGMSIIDMGSNIVDASTRTGLGIESLQRLKYAAEQSGTSMDDVEASVKKMQKAIVEGSDAFGKLGLSLKDLKGLSPEQQFAKVAEAISRISDPAQRTAAAMAIFGKSGTGLLPMIEDGKAGLEGYAKSAEKLGLVMSEADAKGIESLGDDLDTIKAQLMGMGASILSSAMPAIKWLVAEISKGIAVCREWIKPLADVAKYAWQIGVNVSKAMIDLAAPAFSILGQAIDSVVGFVQPLIDSMQNVVSAVKGVAQALHSGDIKLAGEIFMEGLINSFRSGWDALLTMFENAISRLALEWNFIAEKVGVGAVDRKSLHEGINADRQARWSAIEQSDARMAELLRRAAAGDQEATGDLKARSGTWKNRLPGAAFDVTSGTSAAGTFNPFAVAGLGGGVQERIAQATELTANGVNEINRKFGKNVAVFA